MNEIATRPAFGLPTPLDLDLVRRIDGYASRLDPRGLGFEIKAADAPGPTDRELMERRCLAIGHWLAPCDQLWLLQELALVVRMPRKGSEDNSSADAKITTKLYARTLAPLPQFALAKAFDGVHRGRVGKPPWRPEPAEIYQAADKACEDLKREKRRLRDVLDAKLLDRPVVDPAKRAAAAAMARELAASISLNGEQADADLRHRRSSKRAA